MNYKIKLQPQSITVAEDEATKEAASAKAEKLQETLRSHGINAALDTEYDIRSQKWSAALRWTSATID